ncbi:MULTISPECIES: NADP-dependent malic enzyme [unclassified Apibacter]|uniref:NADP-dependent malic enzyme n=1 Tax=unclassified Apibacter TaxID=2630820 RepID=UPI001324307E|nr:MULTISPECIES: NADP-dependent malic enzyme [unclassified Apibacter]MCX8677172.1 NADP-dependent malic enzyme [Apibacter sp. B3919]MXO24448.1 NADP-dependent malic enzyme [Apibacter sp. B3924]MXO25692.1 NADP-dependent malic enzyme [Apibacter sp. B3813]MXO27643.1 NADP-dependent malic enzyme [Apibacter sp. B3913]MXO29997.1 NADP-dependent malic enzyme [Apibacter sp. B3912]
MSREKNLREAALEYHSSKPEGKIEVIPTKPHSTQTDLSLAYSPGVAEPCLEIQKNSADSYKYTSKGNLVAVISNGTAVLGLGDIGADASKPVMEGKGLLFKIFAGINVFDIEINEKDPEKFIEIVKSLAPTFGGINLEDIKAPEAFEIEKRLKAELNIPVMHDDQHGTAIISAAALLNALEISKKNIAEVKIVVSGAGAAAISCTRLYKALGASPQNILMCDSKGVIYKGRTGLNEEKLEFAVDTPDRTLEDAMKNSDVFIGLSKGNLVSPEMLLSMNENPIVFAMANPTPEIDYNLAVETRKDVIMATGRSDYPNQVNNVLGFPYIFRGALDVRATDINQEMQLAAVKALADLAKQNVPEQVIQAYNVKNMKFGRDYIIPKPFDKRLITKVSMAVAKAAIDSGVAQHIITDWNAYEEELLDRMGSNDEKIIRQFKSKAKSNPKRIIFDNAEEYNVLKAAQIIAEEKIAQPILLGKKDLIEKTKQYYNLEIEAEILDIDTVSSTHKFDKYVEYLYDLKQKNGKGITSQQQAAQLLNNSEYLGAIAVEMGEADSFLTGFTKDYTEALNQIIKVVDYSELSNIKVASAMVLLSKNGPIFISDTSLSSNPCSNNLDLIVQITADFVKKMGIEPRIAMVSNENFAGNSVASKSVDAVVWKLNQTNPDLLIDGEIQPEYALNDQLISKFPFSKLGGKSANVLIFPDITSANLSASLAKGIGSIKSIGPVLLGLDKSIQIITENSKVEDIVNLATLAALAAQ